MDKIVDDQEKDVKDLVIEIVNKINEIIDHINS